MTRYIAAQGKVIAIMEQMADANGDIHGLSLREIQRITRVPWSTASIAVQCLIDAGRIIRTAEGRGSRSARYRLGGTATITKPVCESVPSGIKSVTAYVPNRISFGLPKLIPISLPRLKCLETSGVEK